MADYTSGYNDEYDDEYDDEDIITAEDCWTVISSFFESKGLVSQQLDSYDEFTRNTMNDIVRDNGHLILDQNTPQNEDDDVPIIKRRYEITFGRLQMSYPQFTEAEGLNNPLWPHEARLRNLTYSCPMFCTMERKVMVARERPIAADTEDMDGNGEVDAATGTQLQWEREDDADPEKSTAKVYIGKLPVMLKSQLCRLRNVADENLYMRQECPYDQGGYFVINGSEKVLIAQERSAANIVQVFQKKGSSTPWVAEIRSAVEKGSRLISTMTVKWSESSLIGGGGKQYGPYCYVTLPYIKQDVPMAIVFRALGVVSDQDILDHICYDKSDTQMLELLKPSIDEALYIQDRETALDFIARRGASSGTKDKRLRYARDVVQKEFLPHISQQEGSDTRKAFFLGYMIHRLLQCVLGRREEDDRDHFGRKRLDLAGPLMANLFRYLFNKLTKEVFQYLQKCVETNREFNLQIAVKSSTITNGLKYSLATGNWGDQKKAASAKAGVSQVLNRYTYASTLSHLRRTNTPIGRDGKLAKPRQLHNTHWGLVCPAETPEGQACGLVKNLSLMCYVSVGSEASPITDYMGARGMELLEEFDPSLSPNATKVFVNGVWVGVCRDAATLYRNVREIRTSGTLSHEITLVRDVRDREFKIFTDAGRVCRPLFVIENSPTSPDRGKLVLKKEHIGKLLDDKEVDVSDMVDEDRIAARFGWHGLLKSGAVEYLDAEEEETAMIIMTPEDLDEHIRMRTGGAERYQDPDEDPHRRVKSKPNPTVKNFTHCEIHPSMLLGICASIIPFPDHNQVSLDC
jgi:DNA-directed RNA polymerase II subunit RPB2